MLGIKLTSKMTFCMSLSSVNCRNLEDDHKTWKRVAKVTLLTLEILHGIHVILDY